MGRSAWLEALDGGNRLDVGNPVDRVLAASVHDTDGDTTDLQIKVMCLCPGCGRPEPATPEGPDTYIMDVHPSNGDECAGSDATVGRESLLRSEPA